MNMHWLETDFPHSLASSGEHADALRACAQAYGVQCDLGGKSYTANDFIKTLNAEEDVPTWLKATCALEATLLYTRLTPKTASAGARFSGSVESLGLQRFVLPAGVSLQESPYNLVQWYEAARGGNPCPAEEAQCYFLIYGTSTPLRLITLNAAQHRLLGIIPISAMLAEAFDHFVHEHAALAAASASQVGPWLKQWVEEGILVAA